jgi:CRP/FNR family transcriptional regulator
VPAHEVNCGDCGLHDICLVEGLSPADLDRLTGMVSTRRRVRRGEPLFRAGDAFDAVYPIRLGFFKTRVTSDDGREQVTGFPMPGDILGFDAISSAAFQCDAIALEDAEVCVVPFEKLESLSREFNGLQRQLHRVLSREIVRDQGVMMLLGTMRAEQRIATFLLNLSQRFAQRGFSSREFILRMTREEIGNYLGLKLETVSRTFSKLQEDGVIAVEQKRLRIEDPARLREIAGATCGA